MPAAALEELAPATDAAGSNIAKNKATLIAGLQARCAAELLNEQLASATVSGSNAEANVATLRSLRAKAIASLKKTAGSDDWSARLAEAEHMMACGNATGAVSVFEAVRDAIARELAAPYLPSSEPDAILALAARVEQAAAGVAEAQGVKDSGVIAALGVASQVEVSAEELAAIRDVVGDKSVTAEQAVALAPVLALASSRHTFVDAVATPSPGFGPWQSAGARNVCHDAATFLDAGAAPVAALPTARAPAGDGLFPAGVKKVLASCPKGTHVLDHIADSCGVPPKSPLAAEDAAYFEALCAIEEAHGQHHQGAALRADLLNQAAFRAATGHAEALISVSRFAEADAILVEVIRADSYIDMWRALKARGASLAALGKVDQSDAMFKQLHAVKLQPAADGDVPLLDSNRYKSSF